MRSDAMAGSSEPTIEDEGSGNADAFPNSAKLAAAGGLPEQDERYASVSRRLLSEFGPGDDEHIRTELFGRLQREVCSFGEAVYRIIVGSVRSAKPARDPGRYFCATVTRRLKEAGFLQPVDDGF